LTLKALGSSSYIPAWTILNKKQSTVIKGVIALSVSRPKEVFQMQMLYHQTKLDDFGFLLIFSFKRALKHEVQTIPFVLFLFL